MAAGRGQFFRSLQRGWERTQTATENRPGAGGAERPGLTGGMAVWPPDPEVSGGQRRRERPAGERARRGGYEEARTLKVTTQKTKTHFGSNNNLMESLPTEVLMKILSYLDSASLFCISLVSKLLHQLAKDDVIWFKIYMSAFGRQMWKPKWEDGAKEYLKEVQPVGKEDLEEAVQQVKDGEERTGGYWKQLYLRTVGRQHLTKWTKELMVLSPHTGLPQYTKRILRGLNVVWELRLRDLLGQESTYLRDGSHFESSMILCWSNCSFPEFHHISTIELHAVRREAVAHEDQGHLSRWSSLVLQLDMKTCSSEVFGKGRLVRLHHLQHGFIVGVWRGNNKLAFIMISLHFHRLVERALLGSPACPYLIPEDAALEDASDSEFGLHGYTLHFVLRNIGTEIMSGHFPHLSARPADVAGGLMELRVISRTDLSQHRALSGKIRLLWSSSVLDGSVENCCFMTLTLLDEFQRPFWCESAPVCSEPACDVWCSDYSGEHFLMRHRGAGGSVKVTLVWLKEQKQFFLIGLSVYVSVVEVNKRFGTAY